MKRMKTLFQKRGRSGLKSGRWFKKLSTLFKYALFCFTKIFMVQIMEKKNQKKNIFESGFDSFDFDDGFLVKVDSELIKNKNKKKQIDLFCNIDSKEEKTNYDKKEKEKNKFNANSEYDLPLFIEDFNESDFFDLSKTKNKKHSPKTVGHQRSEKIKNKSNSRSYLSPILGSKLSKNKALSSSTPAKQSHSNFGEKQKASQKMSPKNSNFDYLEADLFDDWDLDEIKKGEQKETVSFSQAMKLIEEAEMMMDSDGGALNQSVDLLTGDVVSSDVGDMFEESFGLPDSSIKNQGEKSSDSMVTVDFKSARKLDFLPEQSNNEENHCFNSDDDFNFVTQDLLGESKRVSKNHKVNFSPNTTKNRDTSSLNFSPDGVIGVKKKRGRCFQIIESDSAEEEGPVSEFQRRSKIKKPINSEYKIAKEFMDLEAEVLDETNVSSDEAEEEGEYDESFLDEESYFSQNCSANMTAKYLESVKTVKRHGSFKIPEPKPFNPASVFSQVPEENNSDYQIDSFCVNDLEEEMKTDLSDLEVAEKILEMDRKKKKKKRTRKIKK